MELAFIKPQENIPVWILLTVVCMERLGKIKALFRNIRAGRSFGGGIAALPGPGEPSEKAEFLRQKPPESQSCFGAPFLCWDA